MARKVNSAAGGIAFSGDVKGYSCGYGVIDMISGVPHVLFPAATIVEVFGLKSSSKTTLILETIAFNQMIDPNFKVFYADFEKMLKNQTGYIQSLGVDTDSENFVVEEFDTMEKGCARMLDVVRNDHYNMVIVDTIAAMRPQAELEKGFAQNKQMGLKGKLMSEFLRNLMADIPSDGPSVVFINQEYKDINNSTFVQLYNTPSSDALAFYAGIRIEVRESTKLKDKRENPYTFEVDEIPVASLIKIKTTKNKVGTPFLTSSYVITYGRGIDMSYSIIAAAQKRGVIRNKGNSKSSFIYPGADGTEKTAVGMSNLSAKLLNNIDDLVSVAEKISPEWAYDASFLKQRLARKSELGNTMNPIDEEYAEGLELEDSLEETEDNENGSSEEVSEQSSGEETPEKTLEEALGSSIKFSEPAEKPIKLNI